MSGLRSLDRDIPVTCVRVCTHPRLVRRCPPSLHSQQQSLPAVAAPWALLQSLLRLVAAAVVVVVVAAAVAAPPGPPVARTSPVLSRDLSAASWRRSRRRRSCSRAGRAAWRGSWDAARDLREHRTRSRQQNSAKRTVQ